MTKPGLMNTPATHIFSMISLQFSCNSRLVLRGGQCSFHLLLCHLESLFCHLYLKIPSRTETNQSLEKGLIPGPGQEMYKMSVEQPIIPDSEKDSKHYQGNVKRTQEPSSHSQKWDNLSINKDNLINMFRSPGWIAQFIGALS